MWGELNLGSNVFTNTPGVLLVDGQPQVSLERAGTEDQLLLTMDVYDLADAGVRHVAKLRRNAWAFNDHDRFDITTDPRSLQLIERESGTVVIEANVLDENRIAVPRATFYTPRGDLIAVEPGGVRIGGITLSGNRFVNCQAGISLNPGGFGIG
jgi:hypothetical protein